MVAVKGVGLGSQDYPEVSAGASMNGPQELGLRARIFPVSQNADRASIAQPKTGDVDRIGSGVLASSIRTDGAARSDITAGVASEVRNADDVLPQMLPSCRKNFVQKPHRKRRGRRTSEDRRLQLSSCDLTDSDGVLPTAALDQLFVGHGLCVDARMSKDGGTGSVVAT